MFFLLSTLGVIYVGYIDKINLYEFFNVLDIIFYFTIGYAFLEFFLHISPYEVIYNDMLIDLQLRAKGLCGHPIIFSSFLSFYMISLIIKYIIYKEFSLLNFLLVIPFLFLSASRTGFLLIGSTLFIFIILEKLYKRPVFVLMTSLLIVFLIGSYSYISNLVGSDLLDRLLNTESQQRLSSYTVAQNVFSRHVWGIGLSKDALKSVLAHSASVRNSKFDVDFMVLDNSFLTLLISYGLFCFLFYIPYLQPLLYSFKLKRRGYPKHFHSLLLLFLVWFLQNFSFDTFYHFQINAFYFFLAILIIKHQNITEKKDKEEIKRHELMEQLSNEVV